MSVLRKPFAMRAASLRAGLGGSLCAAVALAAGSLALAAGGPAGLASPASLAAPDSRAGFAPVLSAMPMVDGPQGWAASAQDNAWAALASATPQQRQQARWDRARAMLGRELGAEALGVLDVMLRDEPDLRIVPTFRLARGAALSLMGRGSDAGEQLGDPALAANPEACLWRLLAATTAPQSGWPLGQYNCGLPALKARQGAARGRFLRAAARFALRERQTALATSLAASLARSLPEGDPEARLLYGLAMQQGPDKASAEQALREVVLIGTPRQRAEAQLGLIEQGLATRAKARPQALRDLAALRYGWRGDAIERRALLLEFRLASEARQTDKALASGAALMRYFPPDAESAATLAALQQQLAHVVAPDNGLPLERALGLFWDYRDLLPMGAEGEFMVSQFGARLQLAGLYGAAANLFSYQLFNRVSDLAQGPLSVRVATLQILAGLPEKAVETIRRTSAPRYSSDMLWNRHRIEAIALTHLGKTPEALAALEGVPESTALKSEILWKARLWHAFAESSVPLLPSPGAASALSEIDQAVVLRRAVALAMLGREAELGALRERYASAFGKLPTAAAFDALTGDPRMIDADGMARAMAAIPSASPAGRMADLLETSAPQKRQPS